MYAVIVMIIVFNFLHSVYILLCTENKNGYTVQIFFFVHSRKDFFNSDHGMG